jgi:ribose transport system substrate-binding protein
MKKEAQIQVDMKKPQSGTPQDQNHILRELSRQGYDAIAVSVIAPREQLQVLNEIADKTSLLTFDSDVAPGRRRSRHQRSRA